MSELLHSCFCLMQFKLKLAFALVALHPVTQCPPMACQVFFRPLQHFLTLLGLHVCPVPIFLDTLQGDRQDVAPLAELRWGEAVGHRLHNLWPYLHRLRHLRLGQGRPGMLQRLCCKLAPPTHVHASLQRPVLPAPRLH